MYDASYARSVAKTIEVADEREQLSLSTNVGLRKAECEKRIQLGGGRTRLKRQKIVFTLLGVRLWTLRIQKIERKKKDTLKSTVNGIVDDKPKD